MVIRTAAAALATAVLLSSAPAAAAEPKFVTTVRDAYPVLSPDGATLLFESTRSGRWALYTATADGGNLKVLLDSGDDPGDADLVAGRAQDRVRRQPRRQHGNLRDQRGWHRTPAADAGTRR